MRRGKDYGWNVSGHQPMSAGKEERFIQDPKRRTRRAKASETKESLKSEEQSTMCAEKQSKAHIENQHYQWSDEHTARYSELLSRQRRNETKCKPALEQLGLQGKESFKSIAKKGYKKCM